MSSARPDWSTLPLRLVWSREQAGLSRGQMARLLGVHVDFLKDVEARGVWDERAFGIGRPAGHDRLLVCWAEACAVSPLWLHNGTVTEETELAATEMERILGESGCGDASIGVIGAWLRATGSVGKALGVMLDVMEQQEVANA